MGIKFVLVGLPVVVCLALAACAAALVRSRARERALDSQLEMRDARLESAERNATSLSERLWAAKRDLDAERGRVRLRMEQLNRQASELQSRNVVIEDLTAQVGALDRRDDERLVGMRAALESERVRSAKLEKERVWLVRGFEGLMKRKRAEIGSLRARLRAGGSAAMSGNERAAGASPAGPAVRDDLQRIEGIGPVLERALNELGITSYRQLAEITPRDRERVSGALRAPIDCDDWAAAARLEHRRKYGEEKTATAVSLTEGG